MRFLALRGTHLHRADLSVSTSLTNAVATENEVILRWQVHLARAQPQKLAVVIGAAVVTAAAAFFWFGNPIPVIVIAFAFVGALSDFLLPVTYELTSTHASAFTRLGKRTMAWKDVRKCYLDDSGVKLSPLARRSRLEAYRGVYLRFGDRREEVLEAVARLKPQNV